MHVCISAIYFWNGDETSTKAALLVLSSIRGECLTYIGEVQALSEIWVMWTL